MAIKIGDELQSIATNGRVARTKGIYDEASGKTQDVINEELYGKYSKPEGGIPLEDLDKSALESIEVAKESADQAKDSEEKAAQSYTDILSKLEEVASQGEAAAIASGVAARKAEDARIDGEVNDLARGVGDLQSTNLNKTTFYTFKSETEGKIEALVDQVNNYKPIDITNNGTIINQADEEDLTNDDNRLKLKNRSAVNGMGFVILRRGDDLATKMTNAETIYDIRYDFDLDGATITLGSNSVLHFVGGSLSNGTVVMDNTLLDGVVKMRCVPKGSVANNYLVFDWFGKKGDSTAIDTNARMIEHLIDIAKPIKFGTGTYYIRNINLDSFSVDRDYALLRLEGRAKNDYWSTLSATIIDTHGGNVFVTPSSSTKKLNVELYNIRFNSTLRQGDVFANLNIEFGVTAVGCWFYGFNSVYYNTSFGTRIKFHNCRIDTCRIGLVAEKDSNLYEIVGCNFHNTAQCISIYGRGGLIQNPEFDLHYDGGDVTNMYAIQLWDGVLDGWYIEGTYTNGYQFIRRMLDAYASHDVEIRKGQFANNELIVDVAFVATRTNRIIAPETLFTACENEPTRVAYIGLQNVLIQPIVRWNGSYMVGQSIVSARNKFPVRLIEAGVKAITEGNASGNLIRFDTSANIYDAKVDDWFKDNLSNGSRYISDGSWAVNALGTYRIEGHLAVAGITESSSLNEKYPFYVRYRDQSSTYQYRKIGDLQLTDGHGIISFDEIILSSANIQIMLYLGISGDVNNKNIVEIFEKMKVSMTLEQLEW